MISISVVSHGQARLVSNLLEDIARHCRGPIELILTVNIPEELPFDSSSFWFPLKIVKNAEPQGFGRNHNSAFSNTTGEYFCVINPDIHILQDPFPAMLRSLEEEVVALVAPRVVNGSGAIEDSARPFPRLNCVIKKIFGKPACARYPDEHVPSEPDWVAGMYMLFRSKRFKELGGFDERYFLYYEDVDICARARIQGWKIRYCPDAQVVHNARRDSHRKLRYLIWHMRSLLRYLISGVGRKALVTTSQELTH